MMISNRCKNVWMMVYGCLWFIYSLMVDDGNALVISMGNRSVMVHDR